MEKNNKRGKFFTVERTSDVITLRLTPQPEYVAGMLVDIVNELWAIFSEWKRSPAKALVFYPPPGIVSPERFEKILAAHGVACTSEAIQPQNPMVRHAMEEEIIREINATQRLVMAICRTDTFFIAALSGKTVLALFGPAMACDLRVVSEDFALINQAPCSKLAPWGGLPWFLTRILGRAKTWELLTSEKNISAAQALELGLVDKIVPAAQLEATSITLAQTGAMRPWPVRVALKRAMDCAQAPLEQYLETEKSLFLSSLEQHDAKFSE